MNENDEVLEQEEQTTDQGDAFVEGFDEVGDLTGANQAQEEDPHQTEPDQGQETDGEDDQSVDDGQAQEDAQATPADEAGSEAADGGVEQNQEPGDTESGVDDVTQPAQKQTWEVNHLGQRRVMEAGEITSELLQKGLDYDRVREQYHKAKPAMELITSLSQQSGVTPEEYIRSVRISAKAASGMTQEEARRAVELEDRESAVAAREAVERKTREDQQAADDQVQRGVAEFAAAFPEVYDKARTDPGIIPEEVWSDVRAGLSLTAAYARYAVSQATKVAKAVQQTAQAAEQHQKNTQRSTGSMKSAGGDVRSKDAFLAGFDE